MKRATVPARREISNIPQHNSVRPRNIYSKEDVSNSWVIEPDPDVAARSLFRYVNNLIRAQGKRLWNNTLFYSMYCNDDMLTNDQGADVSLDMPRMAYNLIKTDTDVVVGTLLQANSRPVIETNNGTYSDWSRARKMQSALMGEWNRCNLYQEVHKSGIDALNTGSGWIKLYINEQNEITARHSWTNNVFMDEYECAYGPCRAIFEVRYVRRDVLYQLHADQASLIAKAPEAPPPKYQWTLYAPEMIMVVEGWAAPVGDRKGRHMMSLQSGSLMDEEWTSQEFPLVQFRVGDKPLAAYGQGYTEQVYASQVYLNKMLNIMEQAAHLGTSPFWVLGEQSGITPDMMTNKTRVIQATDPSAVQYHYQPPFHPDAYTYTREIERFVHNFYGINQLQANTTDSGLNRFDSSKAMNAYIDSSDTRHLLLLQRWEDFFVQIARRTIHLAGVIAKTEGGYPVAAGSVKYHNNLTWRDIMMEEDSYRVSVAAANVLGATPSQRIDSITGLMQDGLLTQAQGQRLIQGPPDLDAAINEVSAVDDYIDFLIDRMLETPNARFIGPTRIDDLPHMLTRISNARLQYITLGAPDESIALFDNWILLANNIIQESAQNAQASQQMQQSPPQGVVANGSPTGTNQPPGSTQPPAGNGQPPPSTGPSGQT